MLTFPAYAGATSWDRRYTYSFILPIDLPDAPFTLVLYRLLNVLYTAVGASSLGPRTLSSLGDEDFAPAPRMDVDFAAGNSPSSWAASDMTTPGHNLLGVLEAARTDVQPLEDGLLVFLVLVLLIVGMRLGSPIIALAGTRQVAQKLLAVVARVPGTEQEVSEGDLVNVPVGPRRGQSRRLRGRDGGDDGRRRTVGDGQRGLSLRLRWRLARGPVWPDEGSVSAGGCLVVVRLLVVLVLLVGGLVVKLRRKMVLMRHVIRDLGSDQARGGQIGDAAHVFVGRRCSEGFRRSGNAGRRSGVGGGGGSSPVRR